MEIEFQNEWQNKLFNLISKLELADEVDINFKKTEKNKKLYEKIIDIQKEKYGKSIIYNEKVVVVNNLLIASYIFFQKDYTKKFKAEIELNIKKAEEKYIVLNYLEELIYKFEKLLEKFYYDYPQWITDFDSIEYLYYDITFNNEMLYKNEYKNTIKILAPHITVSLQDFLEYLQSEIEDMLSQLELLLKKSNNIPEARFYKSLSKKVLALYYYFMFEAKELDSFDKISEAKEISKNKAMQYVLKRDGHEYSTYFRNVFYAIKKETKKDPFNKKDIKTVLEMIKNPRAREIAEEELYKLQKKVTK